MRLDRIPVSNLRLAKVRYYEFEHGGCEIPEIEAYTWFAKVGDKWLNVFHPLTECNVYDRVPYSNSTKNGETYGTKITLVNGKEENGVCYVLEPAMKNVYGCEKEIAVGSLVSAVCRDLERFYIDRWDLCFHEPGVATIRETLQMRKADSKKRKAFLSYIKAKQIENHDTKEFKKNRVMRNEEMSLGNLRMAKVRYYETENNGCEIPEIDAYAIFNKVGDKWVNVLHPLVECNVYDRVPYSNRTQDGEDHGTKIKLVNGKEEDGVCYVLEPQREELYPDATISVDFYVRNVVVFDMRYFFIDRWNLCFGERDFASCYDCDNTRYLDASRQKVFDEYLDSKKKETYEKKVYKKTQN